MPKKCFYLNLYRVMTWPTTLIQCTHHCSIHVPFNYRGSLNNYLVWKLVHKFLPYLSKAFTEVVDLYRNQLTGAQKSVQRWEFCADTTQMFFGHLTDSLLFQNQVKIISFIAGNRFKNISG